MELATRKRVQACIEQILNTKFFETHNSAHVLCVSKYYGSGIGRESVGSCHDHWLIPLNGRVRIVVEYVDVAAKWKLVRRA